MSLHRQLFVLLVAVLFTACRQRPPAPSSSTPRDAMPRGDPGSTFEFRVPDCADVPAAGPPQWMRSASSDPRLERDSSAEIVVQLSSATAKLPEATLLSIGDTAAGISRTWMRDSLRTLKLVTTRSPTMVWIRSLGFAEVRMVIAPRIGYVDTVAVAMRLRYETRGAP